LVGEYGLGPPAELHAARTKSILAAHPDVRHLIGRNPWTAVIAFVVVVFQVGLAAVFGHMGLGWWPLSVLCAWLVGAFANHCLYVVIHDAAHDLIFTKRSWNKAAAIFADLPNLAPGAISFRIYHLQHHAYLGKNADPDVPSAWEMRIVGDSSVRKALWLLLFPLVQISRALRVGGADVLDPWALLNMGVSLGFTLLVLSLLGPGAVLYLFASFCFSIGLHPLGARWIQEHYRVDSDQDTSSYYGPLNVVALNIGYHNEHHDFPSVPWSRLPSLKAAAPEFYYPLHCHRSLLSLFWRFLFDPECSLSRRAVRVKAPS